MPLERGGAPRDVAVRLTLGVSRAAALPLAADTTRTTGFGLGGTAELTDGRRDGSDVGSDVGEADGVAFGGRASSDDGLGSAWSSARVATSPVHMATPPGMPARVESRGTPHVHVFFSWGANFGLDFGEVVGGAFGWRSSPTAAYRPNKKRMRAVPQCSRAR
jgi:hypothetical protein